ncbi:tumor necrosis factor receptor superfamily member 6 [Plakobranchus ocellatus]|uniref:Tumor necrosis factor receptor superfamily member 6 n=1 Tax=Plakobranchus ocellatus TaxID=259542 RepID=A0AAV4BUI0_9GAST|nr:tumor necrosis factor receptor superfamily member 6 [Plakobranchus ocellatus]
MKDQRVLAQLALVILLAFCTEISCCGRGEFVASRKVVGNKIIEKCQNCADGFYNDQFRHSLSYCFQCSVVDKHDSRKILLQNCTQFQNTKVGCKDNFFYADDHIGGDCLPCSDCLPHHFLVKKCSNNKDTICCPKENTTSNKQCEKLGYDRFDDYRLKNRNDSKPDAEGRIKFDDRRGENKTKINAGSIISFNITSIFSWIILQVLMHIFQ